MREMPLARRSTIARLARRLGTLCSTAAVASLAIAPATAQQAAPEPQGPLIRAIESELRIATRDPAGYMFSLTDGNVLPPDWIIQTNNRDRGGEAHLRAVADLMMTAQHSIDITSLGPLPKRGSGYYEMLAGTLGRLARDGRRLTVRMLFGRYEDPRENWNVVAMTGSLSEQLKGSGIDLAVAEIETKAPAISWNHSKIVTVDGARVLVGGHNFYSDDYLTPTPVFDLSIRVDGPAAISAQRYASKLWEYACNYFKDNAPLYQTDAATFIASLGKVQTVCMPYTPGALLPAAGPQANGAVSALAVSHGGVGLIPGLAPFGDVWRHGDLQQWSDYARDRAFAMARQSIRISQQAIQFPVWPYTMHESVARALGEAVMRGVDVYVVVSNNDAALYSSKVALSKTVDDIYHYIRSRPGSHDQMCRHFNLTTIAFDTGGGHVTRHWEAGKGVANHAKFYMVDDRLFYVGSHNIYPPLAHLLGANEEFGFQFDSPEAAQQLRAAYWDPLWAASKVGAYIGGDTRCPLPR